MVHQIPVVTTEHLASAGYGGGAPQVQVHFDHRDIFGNGIAVRVYGEIKMASGERVYAHELGLKTLQVLILTPEVGFNNNNNYTVQKTVYHKGEFNNYASVDIYDDAGAWQGAGTGPVDGSIWLDFEALGE